MINPEYACAFVVCNPDKVTLPEKEVRRYLSYVTGPAYYEGSNIFIVALNSDIQMMAAEEIIRLRKVFPNEIKFCAIESHGRKFPRGSNTNKLYKKILKEADEIIKIPIHCSKRANDACNEWLIDHVNCLIPIYTGDKDLYNRMVVELLDRGKGISYLDFHTNPQLSIRE